MAEEQKSYMEKQLIPLGRSMINRLFVLLKTAQNYREGHNAMSEPVAQFLAVVRGIQALNSEAVLMTKAGYLSLGEMRLRYDLSGVDAYRFVLGTLQGYSIRSITFTPAVTDVEIRRFAYTFTEIPPVPSQETCATVQERLRQRLVEHIEVRNMHEDQELSLIDHTASMNSKARAKRLYFQAMKEAAEVIRLAAEGRPLQLMKSKRIVQNMVDQLVTDESHLLALTSLKSNDSYTCNHLVNVAIFSMAMGQRIGLSKSRRCDLGIAALYHDIGKSFIPDNVLDKEEDYSATEEAIIQEHPLLGVKALMELRTPDRLLATMAAATLDHHLHHDSSGYPKLISKKQCLFGRIIAIADDFDSLTSSHVYYCAPHAPEKVIRFMLSRSCRIYDPILVKVFINVMGVYPIGTLVLLNTRELAVVLQNNADPAKWVVPVVKIVAYPDGEEVDGDVINLADGRMGRSIQRTINPHPYHIEVAGFLGLNSRREEERQSCHQT